jgi:hypothetical protein
MNINRLEKLKSKALSNTELMRIVKHKCNLMTYRDLQKIKTLDEALGQYGCFILLYELQSGYGHWTCCFRVNKTTVECFDSYGIKPDDEIKFVKEDFRRVNYLKYPHLTALLYFSGYKVIFNEFQLQLDLKSVSTCGRWVGLRILLRNIPQKQFAKMFLKYKDPDLIVTYLTEKF